MKQAQEAFSKVDTKKMTNKLHQAVNFMKKKMQDLKKSSENNKIAIKVNNKDAQKQITQIEKEIDSLQKKITGRQLKLDVTNNALDKIRNDTNQSVIKEMPEAGNKQIKVETYKKLDNNASYQSLVKQSDKLNSEIEKYNALLNSAKSKMAELGQQTSKTSATQNKLSSFFGAFKQKIEQVKPSLNGAKNTFSKMPSIGQNLSKITQSVTGHIRNMGGGLKNGLGHILKYAGALFSLQSIYSTLSGCAQSWLSSQNAGAKQLSANIDYMKYAMGSAFAPVIQYVTGLVYQLMEAIQSVVYALFRVNIFAKASASSYTSMARSAKKAKEETKQLAGVHDEINNISDNNSNSDSGSSGSTSPSFDLSGIDNQMSALSQKLYDFFKPLVDSWNKYGPGLVEQIKTTAGQVGGLISSAWGSFEKIITNGTVYTSLELILAIIGNIAEAFANAWNYNGNGDAIVQNLANAFNNLLGAINNVVQSEGFQNWLNNCSDKFRVISEKIAEIDWQPLIDALSTVGENIGTLALDILSGLVDVFKWLVENPIVAEIILGIAVAIGVLSTAYSIWATVTGVLTAVSTALNIAILPLVAIIAGIVAVIALVVVAIMNWGAISEWLGQKFEEAKEAITNAFQNIGQWFEDRKNDICNAFSDIGNWFMDKFNNAKDGVQNAFQNIGNWFKDRKNDITNTFSNIGQWFSDKFNNAVQGIKNAFSSVKTFFSGVWQGICGVFGNVANWFRDKFSQAWQAVKNVFSTGGRIFDGIKEGILSGLKAIVNAIINGINKVIAIPFNGLNTALRTIRSANIMGLTPFSWISTIAIPQIPRLAKGNVAYDETLAIFGEYSGASNNPEITTPQNIMRDTFEDVLSNYSGNGDDRPIYLTVKVGDSTLGQILLDDLRDKKRRTGKDIEALIGG